MTTHGQRIQELRPGQSVVLEKIISGGSLEARRLGTGKVQFYWRFTVDKKTERVPIGPYDPLQPPKSLKPTNKGYSVQAALEAARDLAKRNSEVPGGLRAEREREAAAQAQAAEARKAAEKHTLEALCRDYWRWLEQKGKQSAYDAKNLLTNHLILADPVLAAKPAALVEKREIVGLVRKLVEAGKHTTARKLRAYLRAAYSCAVKADSDVTLPDAFAAYKITSNPVESISALRGNADKNPLSAEQLRKYWQALQDEEGVTGAALRLHVATGGQRPAQLVRLTGRDVTRFSLKLLDSKGKRTEAREHILPVTDKIRAELDQLPKTGWVLSTDGGKTHMHATSLSTWAGEVAERAGIKDFQLKRVRSGIETLLAAARVDKQVRGQLQSHGIGGVQDKHYDDHDYLPQKREALATLYKQLKKPATRKVPAKAKNVAHMPTKAGA